MCLVLFVVARQQERAALNEQVGEAERRAQLNAEAAELRARLARNAARRKRSADS